MRIAGCNGALHLPSADHHAGSSPHGMMQKGIISVDILDGEKVEILIYGKVIVMILVAH